MPTHGQVAVDEGLHPMTLICGLGQKDMANPVLADGWQLEIHDGAEEGVWKLDQDAGPVTCPGISTHSTAMGQALQYLQALLDDRVALAVFNVADETDAAGIMLVDRVVESLRCREGTKAHSLISLIPDVLTEFT